MNILCRLWMHRWKPTYRKTDFSKPLAVLHEECARTIGVWRIDGEGRFQRYWLNGYKCTRCNKRRSA